MIHTHACMNAHIYTNMHTHRHTHTILLVILLSLTNFTEINGIKYTHT